MQTYSLAVVVTDPVSRIKRSSALGASSRQPSCVVSTPTLGSESDRSGLHECLDQPG
jgi:hypothetical protein